MYAMISHHDSKYQPLADLTWEDNKTEYAARHGYGMYTRTDNFVTKSPTGLMTGFEKIYIAKEILSESPEVEWLWWTGTDSMITNMSTKIEDRVDNNYHFMICMDVNGINADSLLCRNSPEGIAFLDSILSLEEECLKWWDTEQRAIARLLGFPGTGDVDWKNVTEVKICDKYKNIVKLLPQRYMNSFNYSLYREYTDHRDKLGVNGNWSFGDWLIHWPACSMEARIQLYNTYKNQVVR